MYRPSAALVIQKMRWSSSGIPPSSPVVVSYQPIPPPILPSPDRGAAVVHAAVRAAHRAARAAVCVSLGGKPETLRIGRLLPQPQRTAEVVLDHLRAGIARDVQPIVDRSRCEYGLSVPPIRLSSLRRQIVEDLLAVAFVGGEQHVIVDLRQQPHDARVHLHVVLKRLPLLLPARADTASSTRPCASGSPESSSINGGGDGGTKPRGQTWNSRCQSNLRRRILFGRLRPTTAGCRPCGSRSCRRAARKRTLPGRTRRLPRSKPRCGCGR